MNPILLIGMLAAAFFLGEACEEVNGKSKLAFAIILTLFLGEVMYVAYLFFLFPISFLSGISSVIELVALGGFFSKGVQIVILKRRIKYLEEAICI